MTKLNTALLASAAIVFAGGLAVPASAQEASAAPAVVKSGKKMKVKLYGQISRVFGLISDGTNQQFRQGQNRATSSRMGIEGRGRIDKDWSLSTRFEFELVGDTNMSIRLNQGGDRELFRIRHTDAAFSHKRLGAVSIGHGDTASNGTSEVTLAPGITTARRGGTLHEVVNGVNFIDKDTGAFVDSVNSMFEAFDGAGRATRIRYDTPVFAGAKASVSYIDGASFDAALRYSGGIGGTKIQGAVGFAAIRDEEDGFSDLFFQAERPEYKGTDRLSGSFSVRTPIGLGVTVSGAREWRLLKPGVTNRADAWNINPSLWYTMNATALGPTTVEYAYQHTEKRFLPDDTGDAHAITLAQVLQNSGTDTFLTARYYDMGRPGANQDSIWIIGGGFRARF